MWTFVQIVVSCVAGSAVFLWMRGEENREMVTIVTLASGFGAAWLAQFVWNWLRYGWKAAKSTSWTP